ncbi:MAG: hypothetical protein KAI79_00785 [Bacteroidales bacterium]|nr:hypothetical protein [Bacteroidales bacterium]
MLAQSPNIQSIRQITLSLNKNLHKVIRGLKNEIEAVPSAEITFFDNWFTDKSDLVEKKMQFAKESFSISLLGIQTLAECYTILDEPDAANQVLRKFIVDLSEVGINAAYEKARLIERKKWLFTRSTMEEFY